MFKKWTAVIVVMLLLFPVPAFAADESEHWVYPELKSYKQRVAKFMDGSSSAGPVTKEEWKSFHFNVLDAEKLDQPIEIYHWATMIEMGVELTRGQEDQLIDMYVYNLVPTYAKYIDRETAVGGLIKLLSLTIVDASWNNAQPDAAKQFSDFAELGEKQNDLVRIAFREGLIDSGTKDKFRPKDNLTNAEAISIMEKVMLKFEQSASAIMLPEKHWAYAEANAFLARHRFTSEQQKLIQAGLKENERVPVWLWHEVLETAIGFPQSMEDRAADYTYGLAQGEFIERDRAIAGVMKIWGPGRDATGEERLAAAAAFKDYGDSFDQSKLAIAYSLGIIQGYGSHFYPKRELTYNEMLVLLSRIAHYEEKASKRP